jgi:small multidrug resistance family-3 protein
MPIRKWLPIAVMLGAAALEVGGDALIRRGLRGGGIALVILGFSVLGSYGLLLTWLRIDFSRLLGAYVGIFALIGIVVGRFIFGERVAPSTWIGLGVILFGSLIIQAGSADETFDP